MRRLGQLPGMNPGASPRKSPGTFCTAAANDGASHAVIAATESPNQDVSSPSAFDGEKRLSRTASTLSICRGQRAMSRRISQLSFQAVPRPAVSSGNIVFMNKGASFLFFAVIPSRARTLWEGIARRLAAGGPSE